MNAFSEAPMIPAPVPRIDTTEEVCTLAGRARISPELAHKLIRMATALEFDVTVISGGRTRAEQDELERQGRPTAPYDQSTHAIEDERGCPRLPTGVDVWTSVAPVDSVKARLGAEATLVGLRWGGGSPRDAETGIPSDWNHLDLGPR